VATRASVVPEQNGIPSVVMVCKSFDISAELTAQGRGTYNLPKAIFGRHIDTFTTSELEEHVRTSILEQVVTALTVQPPDAKPKAAEPNLTNIVYKGTFKEVNEYFYSNEWSDGLPIVPPTVETVQEFLKFTDRSPGDVIGSLLPDNREATIWNIAVNGVMAGCRPEYMPILIALVEVIADPCFGLRHLGNTHGAEVQIYLNGPIIKQLDFNYEQGVLRPGFQANISIGRFCRLYIRNVAGFLPKKTDKATFGGTFRCVLAENEDFIAKIGWQSLSVDQGFQAGENVVTANSCISNDTFFGVVAEEPKETLDRLATRLIDIGVCVTHQSRDSGRLPMTHQLIISPRIAEHLAKYGYTKEAVKQYLWKHSFFPAKRFNLICGYFHNVKDSLCEFVKRGDLPASYCESEDPERMVPLYPNPEALVIAVSGDPARDNAYFLTQNGKNGYLTSKRISLPAEWEKLLKQAN
jgi:hypothetical protein